MAGYGLTGEFTLPANTGSSLLRFKMTIDRHPACVCHPKAPLSVDRIARITRVSNRASARLIEVVTDIVDIVHLQFLQPFGRAMPFYLRNTT